MARLANKEVVAISIIFLNKLLGVLLKDEHRGREA